MNFLDCSHGLARSIDLLGELDDQDPSLELLMETFDRVCGSRAPPLARWQASEGEQAIARFLQTVGDGAVLKPPSADEGFAARFDLLTRRRIDHVGVVGGDLVVQALGRVREEIAMLRGACPYEDREGTPYFDGHL